MKPKYANATPAQNGRRAFTLPDFGTGSGGRFSKKVGRNHQKGRSQTAEVVEALRKTFPLAILLPIANLARSSFFYHNKPKTDKDSEVKARILEIKQKEPYYGYRRVAIKLGDVNHKRVQCLIKEMGLQILPRKRRTYRSYRGEVGKIAPNQLQRNFKATKPAQKWLTDITEFRVKEEKHYFSPILDCFNNEIIAYNLSRRPNFQQVQQMLEQAVRKCPKNATPISLS